MEKIDASTGEITEGKPLYVFKPENIGSRMCVDDKVIAHEGFTILSNGETGKIAMMLPSCRADEVSQGLSLFGKTLDQVRYISCDMSAGYIAVCRDCLPWAKIVIDKFHVMQYVYDAVLEVWRKTKKDLSTSLSKGKEKTEEDRRILQQLDVLKHCRYRLTQSREKWSETGAQWMQQAFASHPNLHTAYTLSQDFKRWYGKSNLSRQKNNIRDELHQFYRHVQQAALEDFSPLVKMLRKHEYELLNYFLCGQTNARAERLNGKIKRFLSNNYGTRDMDFALYRTAAYFS